MGCPYACFPVFNMQQKSESLKSGPALSGLVQRGKKLADPEFFLFLLISQHKCIVTQPRPARVRRAGCLPPLLPGSRSQPGPWGSFAGLRAREQVCVLIHGGTTSAVPPKAAVY